MIKNKKKTTKKHIGITNRSLKSSKSLAKSRKKQIVGGSSKTNNILGRTARGAVGSLPGAYIGAAAAYGAAISSSVAPMTTAVGALIASGPAIPAAVGIAAVAGTAREINKKRRRSKQKEKRNKRVSDFMIHKKNQKNYINLHFDRDLNQYKPNTWPYHSIDIFPKKFDDYTHNVDKASILLPLFLNEKNTNFWLSDINNLQFYEKDNSHHPESKSIQSEDYKVGMDSIIGRREPLRIFIKDPKKKKYYTNEYIPADAIIFTDIMSINVCFVRRKPYIDKELYVHKYAISDREHDLKEYILADCNIRNENTDNCNATEIFNERKAPYKKSLQQNNSKTNNNTPVYKYKPLSDPERRRRFGSVFSHRFTDVGQNPEKRRATQKSKIVKNDYQEQRTEVVSKRTLDGKYGIRFSTDQGGRHNVTYVNPGSVSDGKIFVDDIIVRINGDSTAGMSHSTLVSKIHERKKLELTLQKGEDFLKNFVYFFFYQDKYFDCKGLSWKIDTFNNILNSKPNLFPCIKPLYYNNVDTNSMIMNYYGDGESPSTHSERERKKQKNPIKKIDKIWTINEQNVSIEKNGFGWMNEIVCKFTICDTDLKESCRVLWGASERREMTKLKQICNTHGKKFYSREKSENDSESWTFEYSLCNILNHIQRLSNGESESFFASPFCPVIKNYFNYIQQQTVPSFCFQSRMIQY